MGRNKYSAGEIKEIGKLLRLKNAGNRLQQKMIRHDLRVDYEFNISDFNEPGKAFGEEELQAAIKRGAIQILDDATIEAMKAKRARDKARDEAERQKEAVASGEQTDWQEAMKELRPEAIAELTNSVFFANANREATALVDAAVSGDPDIYPDQALRERLFTEELLPLRNQRERTRLWTTFRTHY